MHSSFGYDTDSIGLFTCVVRLSQNSLDIQLSDAFSSGQKSSVCNCSCLFTKRSSSKQTMTMTNERIVSTFTIVSFFSPTSFRSVCVCGFGKGHPCLKFLRFYNSNE